MTTKQTYCECSARAKHGKVREPWTLAKIFGARPKAGDICTKCGYVKWTFPSPLDVKRWYDSMKPRKKEKS